MSTVFPDPARFLHLPAGGGTEYRGWGLSNGSSRGGNPSASGGRAGAVAGHVGAESGQVSIRGLPVKRVPEKCWLLYGPYTPPSLKRGDKATCLFRDCDVIVTAGRTRRSPGRAAGRWGRTAAARASWWTPS